MKQFKALLLVLTSLLASTPNISKYTMSQLTESYRRLSKIGQYATMLLIATRFEHLSTIDTFVDTLFIESIIVYIVYWIYLSKRQGGFFNYYFERITKSVRTKRQLIIDGVYVALFTVSFFIKDAYWSYFQYSIVLLAILILVNGILSPDSLNSGTI